MLFSEQTLREGAAWQDGPPGCHAQLLFATNSETDHENNKLTVTVLLSGITY